MIWTASTLSAQDKLTRGVRRLRHRDVDAVRADPPPHQHQRGDPARPRRRAEHFRVARHPARARHPSTSSRTAPCHWRVRFDRVCFRYPDQAAWAIEDFSLEIAPGETVALVGSSGSGKSTLVNLIARFFEPTQGRILLDGATLCSLPLPWLRGQPWVGQQVVLFDDSVAANIAYGRADIDEQDIVRAARAQRTPGSSSRSCPTASPRASARTAASSPAASASASPSPAPSSRTPHPAARRSHLGARQRVRARGQGCARRVAPEPHRACHRHRLSDPRCRPHRGDGRTTKPLK